MTVQIAQLYATACLGVVFFQFALIGGLPLGPWTQGGRHPGPLPFCGRVVAAVSVPVVIFQGVAVVSAAGFPGLGWPVWTGWLAFAVSAITAVLNAITPGDRERAVWLPVTIVMAGLSGYVMAMTMAMTLKA